MSYLALVDKCTSSTWLFKMKRLLFLFLLFIISSMVEGQDKQSIQLRYCRSTLLPVDLSKELGTVFAPGLGHWYNKDGVRINNVFEFPNEVEIGQKFDFTYKLTNYKSTCLAESDVSYSLSIIVSDLEMPTGNGNQLFCYAPGNNPVVGDLKANGDNIRWYSSPDSFEPLSADMPLENNVTYYASSTLIGCGESIERLAVTVFAGITPDINFNVDVVNSFFSYDLSQLISVGDDINNTNGIWSYYDAFPDTINDIKSLIIDRVINESKFVYAMKSTDIGCYSIDSINIVLDSKLEIPRGFSPNNDGSNDRFVIKGLEAFQENELIIANRNGNIVYKAVNYENNWDGVPNTGISIGNGVLPEGTYFIVLKLKKPEGDQIIKEYVYIKY